MDLDKTNLIEGSLIITNDDGSITCIPEESCTEEQQIMFAAFREEYPDGKPVVSIEADPLMPTQEDIEKAERQITLIDDLMELGVIV